MGVPAASPSTFDPESSRWAIRAAEVGKAGAVAVAQTRVIQPVDQVADTAGPSYEQTASPGESSLQFHPL